MKKAGQRFDESGVLRSAIPYLRIRNFFRVIHVFRSLLSGPFKNSQESL
jgi:hypothetical protein